MYDNEIPHPETGLTSDGHSGISPGVTTSGVHGVVSDEGTEEVDEESPLDPTTADGDTSDTTGNDEDLGIDEDDDSPLDDDSETQTETE